MRISIFYLASMLTTFSSADTCAPVVDLDCGFCWDCDDQCTEVGNNCGGDFIRHECVIGVSDSPLPKGCLKCRCFFQ